MGKNNRQRRAAKQRAKQQARRPTPNPAPRKPTSGFSLPKLDEQEPLFSADDQIMMLLELVATGITRDRRAEADAVARLAEHDPARVARIAERQIGVVVAQMWKHGWQPAELVRHVRRSTTALGEQLIRVAVAADHAKRDPKTLDPRWRRQVESLSPTGSVRTTNWIAPWSREQHLDRRTTVDAITDVLRSLTHAGPLPSVIPGPGHPDNSMIDLTTPVDDPILQRVRALLAQAESTNYEPEAETFTAKAQELMTRYAIDEALLDARAAHEHDPITLRIAIDDPYADAKSLLAQRVAESSRCSAVFHGSYSMSSIVGLPADVAAAEMLFTSLLVQANTAMRNASAGARSGDHTRSRNFRASFWLAYAIRVGERLDEINSRLVHEADDDAGGALLPVLARRSARVDAAVQEMFGNLVQSSVRGGTDCAGWAVGKAAAEAAQLSHGTLTS